MNPMELPEVQRALQVLGGVYLAANKESKGLDGIKMGFGMETRDGGDGRYFQVHITELTLNEVEQATASPDNSIDSVRRINMETGEKEGDETFEEFIERRRKVEEDDKGGWEL